MIKVLVLQFVATVIALAAATGSRSSPVSSAGSTNCCMRERRGLPVAGIEGCA